jgi:hypothetical protein
MTRRFEISAIILSTFLQGSAYLFWGQPSGLALVIIVGGVWLLTALRGRIAAGTVCFVLSSMLTMLAALGPEPGALVLVIWIITLAAWDLSRFNLEMRAIEPPEAAYRIEKLHLKRLGYTLGAGSVAGLLAIYLRVHLSFSAAVLLGFAGLVILSIVVRRLFIRDTQPPDA